jgi:hypothetical protein
LRRVARHVHVCVSPVVFGPPLEPVVWEVDEERVDGGACNHGADVERPGAIDIILFTGGCRVSGLMRASESNWDMLEISRYRKEKSHHVPSLKDLGCRLSRYFLPGLSSPQLKI